jgi:hypothetical protein
MFRKRIVIFVSSIALVAAGIVPTIFAAPAQASLSRCPFDLATDHLNAAKAEIAAVHNFNKDVDAFFHGGRADDILELQQDFRQSKQDLLQDLRDAQSNVRDARSDAIFDLLNECGHVSRKRFRNQVASFRHVNRQILGDYFQAKADLRELYLDALAFCCD